MEETLVVEALATDGGNPSRRSPRHRSGGGGAGAECRDAGGGALQAQVSLVPVLFYFSNPCESIGMWA
jgi:hypothetical protein